MKERGNLIDDLTGARRAPETVSTTPPGHAKPNLKRIQTAAGQEGTCAQIRHNQADPANIAHEHDHHIEKAIVK